MFESLKARLTAAKLAVQAAEDHIHEVTERSPERLAVKQLDERKTELAAAELAIKVEQLNELDRTISQLLEEKAALRARIRTQLTALVPDLRRLNEVEQQGAQLSSTAFNLAMESQQPPTSRWRDPRLPRALGVVRQWLARLEG